MIEKDFSGAISGGGPEAGAGALGTKKCQNPYRTWQKRGFLVQKGGPKSDVNRFAEEHGDNRKNLFDRKILVWGIFF